MRGCRSARGEWLGQEAPLTHPEEPRPALRSWLGPEEGTDSAENSLGSERSLCQATMALKA